MCVIFFYPATLLNMLIKFKSLPLGRFQFFFFFWWYSLFFLINFILFLNLTNCISFSKYQNESTTGIHYSSPALFFFFHLTIGPRAPSVSICSLVFTCPGSHLPLEECTNLCGNAFSLLLGIYWAVELQVVWWLDD